MIDGQEDPVLGLYRFRQHVCRPEEELKLYTQPLNSASVEFITHMTISGDCLFTGNELLSLADMKNLGVLELIKPADDILASYPHVSDRIVRGWSEAVDPFPLLRVLRIWGDRSVTEVSLRWAAKFPSLVLYDVMAGKDDWTSAYEEAGATGWTVSQQVTRAEDASILRYLMLLAPGEDMPMSRFSDVSRSIDVDLINLSSDPRCVLKRVPYGEAPPLLDYLVDPAKVSIKQPTFHRRPVPKQLQFCHETAFETWAFWLYSLIGQLSGDRDLKSRGVRPEQQTVVGPFVLPSKPMASVFLGHSGQGGISSKPSYISRGLFATKRFTFTRLSILDGIIPSNTRVAEGSVNPATSMSRRQPTSLKNNKRRRIEDVLGSFG
ncbi:coenzyme A transferase [Cordyceps javanica]|uniref:Coenzyme A transferase n=1 Tax=Cordyceps javanica TaxID=43265 RepID=A0A545V967_9HYPO|nr:coenzyme A transferase [Cordyceps javanica]TQW09483.1 coenzyme A transferase [Cordyceps javanica]